MRRRLRDRIREAASHPRPLRTIDPATLEPGLLAGLARRGEPVGSGPVAVLRPFTSPGVSRVLLGLYLLVLAVGAGLFGWGLSAYRGRDLYADPTPGGTRMTIGVALVAVVLVTTVCISLTGSIGAVLLGPTWLARRSWRSLGRWQVLTATGIRRVRFAYHRWSPPTLVVAGRGGRVHLADPQLTAAATSALGPFLQQSDRAAARLSTAVVVTFAVRTLTDDERADDRRRDRWRSWAVVAYVVLFVAVLVLVLV